jgi:hypothetical protein
MQSSSFRGGNARCPMRVPAELAGGAELIAIASALGDEEYRGR